MKTHHFFTPRFFRCTQLTHNSTHVIFQVSNTAHMLHTCKRLCAVQDSTLSHTSAIKNKKVNQTALSAFIHDLKDLDIEYDLTWKILEVTPSYDGRHCRLCLAENTHILFNHDPNLLNKITELMGACRHEEGWRLSSEPAFETQPADANL